MVRLLYYVTTLCDNGGMVKKKAKAADGPNDIKARSIRISNKSWDAWQEAAERYETTITALIREGVKLEIRRRQRESER